VPSAPAGLDSLLALRDDPVALQIIRDIRAPRALGAWLAGALLGLAGAMAQGLFRNPLADPYLLGSASGASLGVAVALVAARRSRPHGGAWLPRPGLTGAAFVGAVGAVLLTLALARGVQHTMRLLLAGVVVGVVLGALGSLVMLLQPVMLSHAGLHAGQHRLCRLDGLPADGGGVPAVPAGWRAALSRVLDGLSLGEATAASLGLPLAQARVALVARWRWPPVRPWRRPA
jgi:iron complex transport system permease protein